MGRILAAMVVILTGATSLLAMRTGSAIDYDGIQDFVMVPHHSSLNPGSGSWTISLWIKPADEVLRSPLVIERQPIAPYEQVSLGIGDDNPHIPVAGRKLYSNYIDSVDVRERSGFAADEFVDGAWHHVALVADAAVDSVLLYVDGVRQEYLLMVGPGAWPDITAIDSLFIAHNHSGRFYKGEMDELSLWARALTPNQIATVMNDTPGPAYYATPDSGLAGYWRFDEFEDLGVGNPGADDVRDLSPWGNHGDAEGNPQLVPSGVPVGVAIGPAPSAAGLLGPNRPNPFNPTTSIEFRVPGGGSASSWVTLKVYDTTGREIAVLVDGPIAAGPHTARFDGSRFPSGVYFSRLTAGGSAQTRKMTMIR